MYNLPEPLLNRLRTVISQDINIHIEAPSQESLFVYDNGSFIVESFLPEESAVKIITGKNTLKIQDVLSGEEITDVPSAGDRIWGRQTIDNSGFEIKLKPHSFRVFKIL